MKNNPTGSNHSHRYVLNTYALTRLLDLNSKFYESPVWNKIYFRIILEYLYLGDRLFKLIRKSSLKSRQKPYDQIGRNHFATLKIER